MEDVNLVFDTVSNGIAARGAVAAGAPLGGLWDVKAGSCLRALDAAGLGAYCVFGDSQQCLKRSSYGCFVW